MSQAKFKREIIKLATMEGSIPVVASVIRGYAVHLDYQGCVEAPQFGKFWRVSHTSSGKSLGATFTRKKQALEFARQMAIHYNGELCESDLIAAVVNRGSLPSPAMLCDQLGGF